MCSIGHTILSEAVTPDCRTDLYFHDRNGSLIEYRRRSACSAGIVEAALTDSLPNLEASYETRNQELLAKIAALLCKPQTVFFQDRADGKIFETEEMLRLWHSITNTADRHKLLALARTLAAKET